MTHEYAFQAHSRHRGQQMPHNTPNSAAGAGLNRLFPNPRKGLSWRSLVQSVAISGLSRTASGDIDCAPKDGSNYV